MANRWHIPKLLTIILTLILAGAAVLPWPLGSLADNIGADTPAQEILDTVEIPDDRHAPPAEPDPYDFSLNHISLIIVSGCLLLLCISLALFWRQYYAIRRLGQRYLTLYDAAPVMYHTLNPDGMITGANQTECNVMGVTANQLIGRNFLTEIIAPEDRPACQAFFDEVARSGSGRQMCRWVRRDGIILAVDMICTAEYDAARNLVEILVCAEDITERKAANERVYFLNKILENMDDVVIVTDNDYHVQYLNLAAERLFLYPGARIHSQPITQLFDTSRLGDTMTQIKAIAGDGGIWQGDIPCLREDGFGIVVSAKVSQLREDDGSPIAIIYTMRDITYQKQIILELRQSEEKYRTIFDQAPLSILLLDGRGNIMDINRWHIKHVDRMHKTRADYLARNILNIKFFTEAGLSSQLRDLLRGEAFEISQARFELDEGRTSLVMSVSGMPLFDDNHVVRGALLILEDITERHELQEQLWRHAVELEEKTRLALHSSHLKSEFLANVSHELRTPLNAIIGFTRLVMKKNKALIAEAQYRNLQHILDSGYHLLELINSILDLSKIEAGRMDMHIERFAFGPFLDSLVKTAEPLMEKNQNLFIQKTDPSIQFVNNDITKLRQVLINLLSNAAKFTTQGTIILKTTHIDTPIDGASPLVQIEIIDSGIGIPENKIEDIFEAFHQADGSTTRQFGGTGLGLTLTKRFCLLMRGNITVGSVMGKGSTFTVTIPIDYDRAGTYEIARNQEAAAHRREAAQGEREVLLLVHNDPDLMQQLRQNLSPEHLILTGASSYSEALNKTQFLLPSLILLDPWIDEPNGWRFIRTLKTQRHTWSIPIILLNNTSHKNWTILPFFDVVFKPAPDTRLHHLCDSIRQFKNPRVIVVDEDIEFLNQTAECFMRNQMPFDIARSFDEANQTALKTQPGILMLNLSNIGPEDVDDLKGLLEFKSIFSVVVIAWQRMSAEEFTATVQNLKTAVQQYSAVHSELHGALPGHISSVMELLDTFKTLTAPPTQSKVD